MLSVNLVFYINIFVIGVCTTGYCKNGGNCYVTEQGKPACDCPPGFLGPQCEKGNYCRII